MECYFIGRIFANDLVIIIRYTVNTMFESCDNYSVSKPQYLVFLFEKSPNYGIL